MGLGLLRTRWAALGASALWAACVLYLSAAVRPAWSGVDAASISPRPDLLAHFVIFAVLAGLLRWSAAVWGRTGTTAVAARALAPPTLAALYGGLMELLQLGISGRVAAWDDLGADSAGALTMIVFIEGVLRIRRRRSTRTIQ